MKIEGITESGGVYDAPPRESNPEYAQARDVPMRGAPATGWGQRAVETWRAAHPHAVRMWFHDDGAYTVLYHNVKTHYGNCKYCGVPMATEHDATDVDESGPTPRSGRWPAVCDACSTLRYEEHADGARGRMRRARRKYKGQKSRVPNINQRPKSKLIRKNLLVCLDCKQPLVLTAKRAP